MNHVRNRKRESPAGGAHALNVNLHFKWQTIGQVDDKTKKEVPELFLS